MMRSITDTPSAAATAPDIRRDRRPTLSRSEARLVYDRFARVGHPGGSDASSGYGGPAVRALLSLASFSDPRAVGTVLEYGCGRGKLMELALSETRRSNPTLAWRGIDQSPVMVQRAAERILHGSFGPRASVELLIDGDPNDVEVEDGSVDRFVSTYCLDLLSEDDMDAVFRLAERALHPESGLALLSGITWGYRDSIRTCLMTIAWNFLYAFFRKKVGGCRPQRLEPYLEGRGWTVVKCVRTFPDSFPWMMSEVIAAHPPSLDSGRKDGATRAASGLDAENIIRPCLKVE